MRAGVRGEQVAVIHPRAFGAYNDCSIRRPNAKKISEKKNWGEESKGLSPTLLPLSHFAAGCELDDYRIACYLERDGELHPYGSTARRWITATSTASC